MNRLPKTLAVAILLATSLPPAFPGPVEPQGPSPAPPALIRVGGEVPRPLELTAEALSRLPRTSVRAKGPDGKEALYEGVPVVEVLQSAGVKFGHDLKGPALATYLIVEAADGYRALFALPELDPASTDRVILLADRLDGKPIEARNGPLRVIVPGEKRHGRWVKQVVALKLGRG